tara:strand:- start:26 stop:313 length:288 start_codon:yes stop_codon:yes gene_type:complete
MNKKDYKVYKASELSPMSIQYGKAVKVTDRRRAWNDSSVEFSDATGELLAIKVEEKELIERLHEEMRLKVQKFWESKEKEVMAIDSKEIPQDICF